MKKICSILPLMFLFSTVMAAVPRNMDVSEEVYTYSDVTLQTCSPEDQSELKSESENDVFLVFTDAVTVDEEKSHVVASDGTEYEFSYIVPRDDSREIQLGIPVDVLKTATSDVKVVVYVTDADGKVVEGNAGEGSDSHFEYTYVCTLGYPELSFYPAAGDVLEIDAINIAFENNHMNVKDGDSKLTLYESDKSSVIQEIIASELEVAQEDPLVVTFKLATAILKKGSYYLHVPAGTFGLGERELDNREMWVKYDVVDRAAYYGVTISPTDGATVAKLRNFTITFDKWDAAAHRSNKSEVLLEDADGNVVTMGRGNTDSNRKEVNQCIITLNEDVIQPGDYRLRIPEGVFILGSWGNAHNEEMFFYYTVDGKIPEIADVTATAVGKAGKLESISLWFASCEFANITADQGTLVVKIYDEGGTEAGQGMLYLGGQKQEIIVRMDPSTPITEEQNYSVVIPGGYLKLNGSVYNYDLSYPFKFAKETEDDIPETTNYRVTPYAKDGKLDYVALLFNDYETAALAGEAKTVGIFDSKENRVGVGTLSPSNEYNNGINVVVDNSTPITADGVYTVVIPEGYLKFGSAVYKHELKGTFKFENEVEEDLPETNNFTVTPVGENRKLSYVVIKFNDYKAVSLTSEMQIVRIFDSSKFEAGRGTLVSGDAANEIKVNISEATPITVDDEYTVEIPVGSLKFGTVNYKYEVNAKFKFENEVEEDLPETNNFTVTPVEEDGKLDFVAIQFDDYDAVGFASEDQTVNIYDSKEQEVGQGTLVSGDAANEIRVKISESTPITESGFYTVVIPENYLIFGSAVYKHVLNGQFKYDGSMGIEDVRKETKYVGGSIYNTAGLRVKEISKPGIYIKGGRKIIIR